MQDLVANSVSFPDIKAELFYSNKSQYKVAKKRFKIPVYLVTIYLRTAALSLFSTPVCFNGQLLLLKIKWPGRLSL